MAGENHLLVIGIDEYSSFRNLNNAKSDAIKIADVLCKRYGFSLFQELFDKDATTNGILQALNGLAGCCLPDDNLIIFFAGHGQIDAISRMGYWLPTNAEKNNLSSFILNSTVVEYIKRIEAKHILLISDSCFSGSFLIAGRGELINNNYYNQVDELSSRWVITSGNQYETVSDGKPNQGSPFGKSLYEFLAKNEQPDISVEELGNEIIGAVKKIGTQNPECQAIECVENKGGQMILRLSTPNKNATKKIRKQYLAFNSRGIPSLNYYIPRTISIYEKKKDVLTSLIEQKNSLGELIISQKKIVLLGNAGSGKSIELQRLSKFLLTSDKPFNTVYKRFNTYIDENIEDYLPQEWKSVKKDSIVILLDGIDEVQPQHFNTAIRKIKSFVESNPTVRIIVSSRTNFYELPYVGFSGTLDNFCVCLLNEISLQEIKIYATEYFNINGTEFINDAYKHHLFDLISKPFFLNILVNHYVKYGSFAVGRAAIMEQALTDYYNNDKEHFNTTKTLEKIIVFSMLEKAAFIMEVLGKNFIEDHELQKIFPKTSDFENIKYLPAFRRDEVKNQWMFEHNNIQEYLASRVLEREKFDRLISVISIELLNEQKVKPTWVNTISFLISIGSESKIQSLLDWIIDNDHEVIIRFEPDRISNIKRIEVFKKVFDFYGEKKIWLSSNKFSDIEFARFGQFEEILDFLISKIYDQQNSRITKLNAIQVFDNFDLSCFPGYPTKIEIALLWLLKDDTHSNNDIYSIIRLIANLRNNNSDTIAFIISKYRKRKSQYIRTALYKLLLQSDYADVYVEVYIDGIDIRLMENAIEDSDNVSLMDKDFYLVKGIENIHTPEALKKILKVLSTAEVKNSLYSRDYTDIIVAVIKNCVLAYKLDNSVYDFVFELFISLARRYNQDVIQIIISFFQETDTKWVTFLAVWNNTVVEQYQKSLCLDFLIDDNVINYFLEGYEENNFNETDIKYLHKVMLWNRMQLPNFNIIYAKLETAALKKDNIIFPKIVIVDKSGYKKDINQKNFNILFNKDEIIDEIKKIYDKIGKKEIGFKELYGLNGCADLEDMFTSTTIELLRRRARGGKKVILEKIIDFIESDNFINNQIEQIYYQLKNNDELIVNEPQREYIKEWCYNNENVSQAIWLFINRLNIQISESTLLDFTQYYDYDPEVNIEQPGTIEQLEKFFPSKSILINRVIENLKDVQNILIWTSNAGYALRNNITNAIPNILNFIERSTNREYRFIELVKYWFNKSQDTNRLKKLIKSTSSNDLRWGALDLLEKNGRENLFLVTYFKEIINSTNESLENKFAAANYLIPLEEIDGFIYTANYLLENPNPTLDFSYKLKSWPKLKNPKTIDLLTQVLFLSKKEEFQVDKFNNLERIVLDAFHNIGIQSDENYDLVSKAINHFIISNEENFEHLNFLYHTLQKIEGVLNTKKSKSYSIDDAINEFNSLI